MARNSASVVMAPSKRTGAYTPGDYDKSFIKKRSDDLRGWLKAKPENKKQAQVQIRELAAKFGRTSRIVDQHKNHDMGKDRAGFDYRAGKSARMERSVLTRKIKAYNSKYKDSVPNSFFFATNSDLKAKYRF